MSLAAVWGVLQVAGYGAALFAGWYWNNRKQIAVLVKAAEQLGLGDVLAEILAAAKARGK